MGRQGPRLVPFLQNGMINKMYRNLISENQSGLIFSIVLPHKTKKLQVEDEFLFKDWYSLNGKKYVFHSKHYTDAKQAITASLRKSDYVEKIHISDDKLTYRILNKTEVKEKKKLKKALKKLNEVKKEVSDSDDALSSAESGYSSGVGSPQNDYAQMSLNDNLITPSGNESGYGREADSPTNDAQMSLNDSLIPPSGLESSPMLNTMETNSFFGIYDVLPSTCSSKFDGFLKPELMDSSVPTENFSLAVPDTPILFEPGLFDNIQPFVNKLKSEDYFPENTEHLIPSFDLMDCASDASELYGSGFAGALPFENDFQQLDSVSEDYLNNILFKDVPFDSSPSLPCADNINNQASETQNELDMPIEPEDILTEKLNKLIEELSAANSMAFERKSPERTSLSPDAGLPDYKTEAGENIYICKKCIRLGKTPLLFCEPQFKRSSTETLSELKIAFDEAVLKEINGFISVKEYKFINDHLMVILEPNDV